MNDLLTFSATPEVPWVVELADLGEPLMPVNGEWLIASASAIEGFDPAAVFVEASGLRRPFLQSSAAHFSVEQRGSDLYLTLTVPEPPAAVVLGCLCAMSLFVCRNKQNRD